MRYRSIANKYFSAQRRGVINIGGEPKIYRLARSINVMATEKNNPTMNRDVEAAPPAPSGHEKHERDVAAKDEAIAMVGEQEHTVDPVVVARAVRKIDWFLIPAMIFGCKTPLLHLRTPH